jgi:hypothetical protein
MVTPIQPYYLSKWKPFRYSLLTGVIVGFIFLLFGLLNAIDNRSLDSCVVYLITYLVGFMIGFLPTLIVLYLNTIVTRWLNPPQPGRDTLNEDWWKP